MSIPWMLYSNCTRHKALGIFSWSTEICLPVHTNGPFEDKTEWGKNNVRRKIENN